MTFRVGALIRKSDLVSHLLKTSFVALVLMLSAESFAGGGGIYISGSGHGIQVGSGRNTRIYLADFFAQQIHLNTAPLPESQLPFKGGASLRAEFGDGLTQKVLAKIEEIRKIDPILSYALRVSLDMHRWIRVDQPLRRLHIDFPFNLENEKIVQLAVRQANVVHISRLFWSQLDEVNQVGLVIHELMASVAKRWVNALRVRNAVAALFAPAYFSAPIRTILAGFPTSSEVHAEFQRKAVADIEQLAGLGNQKAPSVLSPALTLTKLRIRFPNEATPDIAVPILSPSRIRAIERPDYRSYAIDFYAETFGARDFTPVCLKQAEEKYEGARSLDQVWTYKYYELIFSQPIEDKDGILEPAMEWSLKEKLLMSARSGVVCTDNERRKNEWLAGFLSEFQSLEVR